MHPLHPFPFRMLGWFLLGGFILPTLSMHPIEELLDDVAEVEDAELSP